LLFKLGRCLHAVWSFTSVGLFDASIFPGELTTSDALIQRKEIAMNPFLGDAINIPMALVAGIIVFVPLLAFEAFIEALVLKRACCLPYGRARFSGGLPTRAASQNQRFLAFLRTSPLGSLFPFHLAHRLGTRAEAGANQRIKKNLLTSPTHVGNMPLQL